MVLKVDQDAESAGGDTMLNLAAHTVQADGMLYQRDGLNYLVVANVESDLGITNQTHNDYGTVPSFSIPKPKK